MACSIEISFSEFNPNNLFVNIYDCQTLKSFVATFPKDKTTFFGGRTHGITTEDSKQYIIVEDTGYFEYISPETEVVINLPTEVAGEFFEYVKAHVGEPVTEAIVFNGAQDPQEAGKRRRRKTYRKTKKCRRSKLGC